VTRRERTFVLRRPTAMALTVAGTRLKMAAVRVC
jgi:hypothetical protein